MKTANVFGNIAVYIKYCVVCLKIDYTLRCLEYICSVSSPLRRHGLSLRSPLNREDTDKCTLTIYNMSSRKWSLDSIYCNISISKCCQTYVSVVSTATQFKWEKLKTKLYYKAIHRCIEHCTRSI